MFVCTVALLLDGGSDVAMGVEDSVGEVAVGSGGLGRGVSGTWVTADAAVGAGVAVGMLVGEAIGATGTAVAVGVLAGRDVGADTGVAVDSPPHAARSTVPRPKITRNHR